MGKPRYSRHARDRMRERSITEGEVEAVLAHPLIDQPSHEIGRRVVSGEVNGRRLTVVVVEGSSPPLIVTVWD
jgi:Domain of unknown function (DUF4258)